MAIGFEQVQPGVIVEVEKAGAVARHQLGSPGDPGGVAPLREGAVTIVPVKSGGLEGEIRHEKVAPAVAIVVARVHAHS